MPNRSVGDESIAKEVARLGRVADAITNPSDDLIERLSKRLNYPWSKPNDIRGFLALLAEEIR